MIRPTEQWAEASLRTLGFALVGVTAAGVLANIVILASTGKAAASIEQLLLLLPFGFVLVWLFRAVPRNTAVWALAWGASFGGLGDAASTLTLVRTGHTVEAFTNGAVPGSPADLDLLGAIALNIASWSWLGIFLVSANFVLLFPSGHVSSRRWGYALRAGSGVLALGTVISAFALAPWVETPFSDLYDQGVYWAAGTASALLMVISVAAIINLIVRLRRSAGEERLQYRWVTSAFAFWAVMLLGFGFAADSAVYSFVYTVALAAIPFSIGIAITKYRLYDIDLVINRALVLAVLAGFITLVYALLVVGVGSLIGGDSGGLLLPIAATAVVALAFEPVRYWAQGWANRLVYGQRATPYEVLSDLTARLSHGEGGEGLLARMAQRLGDGTGAERATIWLGDETGMMVGASWPDISQPPGEPDLGASHVFPVTHDGVLAGALEVIKPRGSALSTPERALIEDLAGSAGAVFGYQRLNNSLQEKALELSRSRARLVDAQDQERRRLERDLHDGAQQLIVALKVKIGLAKSVAVKHGSSDLESLLDGLGKEAEDALDEVRRLAKGIYPPVLESDGLPSALSALASGAAEDVIVRCNGLKRYGRDVEAAVYFDISEAVTNAIKHGSGPIHVDLVEKEGELHFSVDDPGPGFEVDRVNGGSGLQNLRDRIDAVGGTIAVHSTPGVGTRVSGVVPVEWAPV